MRINGFICTASLQFLFMFWSKVSSPMAFSNLAQSVVKKVPSLPKGLAAIAFNDVIPSAIPLKGIPATQSHTQRVSELQRSACTIIQNYDESKDPFDPVPWLQNPHVQTIGGYIFRKLQPDFAFVPKNEAWFQTLGRMLTSTLATPSTGKQVFWHHRERIETPDQDWFHVDVKYAKQTLDRPPARSIVLLLHGLQSNSNSPICREMAMAFLDHPDGMDECHCLNFRGCSGQPNDKVGGYHLGFTDDLRHYLRLLQERFNDSSSSTPPPSIYLVGFSLGANVILKCLGELGPAAVDQYRIAGAAVVCAPLDQVANAPVLAQPGIHRLVYTQNLLKSLQKKCHEQYDQFYNDFVMEERRIPVLFNYTRAMSAQTITEFDDAFIAPVYNFTDCWDYYRQTSSINYLQDISVPTLMLNARDDPFFNNSIWPDHWSVDRGGTLPIQMVQTAYGGHLGYYFHRQDATQNVPSSRSDHPPVVPSWSILQLGRFLSHVKLSTSPFGFPVEGRPS